jgi:hypothetical protein
MYMVKSLGKFNHIFDIVQDPLAIDAHLKMHENRTETCRYTIRSVEYE